MSSRPVRIVVRDLRSFSERTIKRLALNINANLVKTTPVDTGWARANWVPNIGGPFEGTAGTRQDAEAGKLDLSPRESGLAAVATSYTLGPEIHQTNNVPYIIDLNAGSSRQAPAAFIQSAIFRAVQDTVRNTR